MTDNARERMTALESQWREALSHVVRDQPELALLHIDRAVQLLEGLDDLCRQCPEEELARLQDQRLTVERLHREVLGQSRQRRDTLGERLERNRKHQGGLNAYGETVREAL